ncbi:MAG: signal peptidase II [Planctomycetota bacterium]|jgi:signal peptidase II
MESAPAPCIPDTSSDHHGQLALRSVPAHLRFWLTALAGIWLDLWSKHHIFKTLDPAVSKPFITDVIHFHRSLNDGAVFGSFTGQVGLFMVASIFALGFVTFLFVRSDRSQWGTQIALGLVFSGAVGNLYDRAFMKADVVEFTASDGTRRTVIGTIIEETDARIRVGEWPGGSENTYVIKKAGSDPVVRQQGVVRDFIRFVPKFPAWVPGVGGKDSWPWVFNIADAALVVGVGILLLSSWFGRPPHERATT